MKQVNLRAKAYLYKCLCCQSHTIIEYTELEVIHKDHWVHLLDGGIIWKDMASCNDLVTGSLEIDFFFLFTFIYFK